MRQYLQYCADGLFVRVARRTDAQMRLGIDGVADRGEFAEHLAWVAILEQRAVAAPADALDEGRDVGVEPQRQAVIQDQFACRVVDEGADAGREAQWSIRERARAQPATHI